MNDIKVIGFDADDTLWICESIFRNAELKICQLLSPYISQETLLEKIFEIHIQNLPVYGYGIKGYILSLTEAALKFSEKEIPGNVIFEIISIGKEMLNSPVELINNVENILPQLKNRYKLIVATKGDLLDQQRKLKNSGISHYFDHIEIMSDKKSSDYKKMFENLNISPSEFMMVGNSLKSDILPVIELGAKGIHIPYEITWLHENVENTEIQNPDFYEIKSLDEIFTLLK